MTGRSKTAFLSGTITNNPLAIGDTNLTSAALASLPAIASPDIAVLVLDPAGTAGAPEVVWVTAHTGAATSATVSRGKEGSSARQHLLAVPWVHGPTLMDYTQRKGTDIASAGTITLPSDDTDYFHITGTTGITAISERGAGKRVTFEFDGIVLLTHNATSLILPGGSNISTRAGDVIEFVSEASGNWRQATPNSGAGWTLIAENTTEQSTTSLTQATLITISNLSIPVTSAIKIVGSFRHSTGAGGMNPGYYYLTLNSTDVGSIASLLSSPNEVMQGSFEVDISPRETSYLRSLRSFASLSSATYGSGSVSGQAAAGADLPNATITSITLKALTAYATITMYAKNLRVYVC